MSRTVPAPSGTVTLLFTDVEGSTRLWESEPDSMAPALRRHDEILRGAIEQAGGFVFKTVGDAFCAAFGTPLSAVRAVLDAQQVLGGERWQTSRPILVRMGVHTGVCEERDNDYFGPVVNRAARLEAVAHGGQVLISGTTAELLPGSLPGAALLRDLGLHRLKDLGRPEQVFQLEAEFLRPDFPPLRSLDNPELPNNLPGLLSAFIGREREVAEVRSLEQSARLVTLTGTGGCGKTRLALQAAAELLEASPDGVWLAELAPLTDAAQIPGAVAVALGLPDGAGAQAASLTEALGELDTLILLDNCEHLIDAVAKLCEQVIRHCPRVRILATSREPLGIDGERVYRVPSLSLPPPGADAVADLAGCDAVRLFAERARIRDPGFTLDESAALAVASICRRLDGIPLALELAAARLSSMSLRQVSERLDQRFRLLTGGSRNAMPRQQTLQATVEWSFGLLNQAERDTLTRLSVFAGGFDLEAAEAVCTTDGVDAFDVLDLLGSLVDKSLVIADRTPDSVRYRLLETIRQYSAQELLRAAGDAEVMAVRDRHAAYYLELAQTAEPSLTGHGQRDWLIRLDLEWDNLRGAFGHLAAEERTRDVLRLGASLNRFALTRGHAEVLAQLRSAISRAGREPDAVLIRAMLVAASLITVFLRKEPGQLAAARWYAETSLAMARELGDPLLEAQALGMLAALCYYARDPAAGRQLLDPAVQLARQAGDTQLLGQLLDSLALFASSDEEAHRIRDEVLACTRQSGDEMLAASQLHHLTSLHLRGRPDDALAHLSQAIEMSERLGADLFVYYLRSDLGLLLLVTGRPAEAAPVVRGCLLAARRFGAGTEVAETIFCAACCAAWQGDHPRAARLFGAADVDLNASFEIGTVRWDEAEQGLREDEQARLREVMGAGEFEQAYQAGTQLSPQQAVELALGRQPEGQIG